MKEDECYLTGALKLFCESLILLCDSPELIG